MSIKAVERLRLGPRYARPLTLALAVFRELNMITVDDLQAQRTPSELSIFVKSTFDSIRSDETIKKLARLRKPPFKELIEEVYPLSIFCDRKYSGSEVKCCPVIGNQGYDARIVNDEGALVENVELTWPIDGQKAHYQAVKLNENGYTEAEVWDVNDASKREDIVNRIIETANKKALKDYSEPEGSSLVFVIDIAPYFGMHEIENREEIDRLIQSLRSIGFKVKSVYLLLLPIKELVQIK